MMNPDAISAVLDSVRRIPVGQRMVQEDALVDLADLVIEFFGTRRRHMVCGNEEMRAATRAYDKAMSALQDAVYPNRLKAAPSPMIDALPVAEMPSMVRPPAVDRVRPRASWPRRAWRRLVHGDPW